MFYLDASLVVTSLVHEPAREKVRTWLNERADGSLFISQWVSTEVSSALSIKQRTGNLTPTMRAETLISYRRFVERSLSIRSVDDSHFVAASEFAEHAELGLRAGDALHLAIAGRSGLTLATLDKQLAAAGPPLGIATLLL